MKAVFNKSFGISCIIVSVVALIAGCQHEPSLAPNGGGTDGPVDSIPTPCDPQIVYFQQQVLPLLVSSCAIPGCHDPATAENDVILNSYENVMATADVRPNDPDGSDLYEVIVEEDPEDRMPPSGQFPPLSAQEIALIRQWILQGATNTSCESATCDTTNVLYSNKIESIVSTKCQGCHSGSNPQGSISLLTYAQVRDQALNGQMLNAVQHTGSAVPMPFNSNQLPQCEIDQIRIWIENGAPQ